MCCARIKQNVTAFQQLGFIWSEQGDPFRAIPFLLKVRELAPQNKDARAKLALSLKVVGQSAEARKEALSILEQDAGNSEAILVLATPAKQRGNRCYRRAAAKISTTRDSPLSLGFRQRGSTERRSGRRIE